MTRLKYFILGTLVISSFAIAQGYMSQLNVGNIRLTGNTISTQNTNGDLTLDMNGTGSVLFTDLTASKVLYLNGSKKLTSSTVTDTELGYLTGVTSSLCGINQSCILTGKTLTGNIADNLVHSSGGVFVHNSTGNITVPSGTDQLVARATTDTLTNKTLTGNTAVNLVSGSGTLVLNTSGTITIPNASDTLVAQTTTDTLTNKTLTSPTLTTPTTDIVLWDDAATPSNPSAGFYKLYFKNDGKLYKLNPAGTEAEVGSGSSGGSSGINILSSYNHNAELGATTFWSESGGGTLSTSSTAANVANGTYAFSFDASASGDYASASAVTIPAGLFGANCLAQFYYKGFDTTVSAVVYDGSVTIASQALTAATTYTTASVNFVCPSSGTLEFRLDATSNAAIGYFDEVHLGSALNITNVNPRILLKASGNPASATSGNPIIFPTKDIDNASAYNNSTGRYTIPATGYYRITSYCASGAGNITMNLYVDAVSNVELTRSVSGTNNGNFHVGTLVSLVAGNVIDIRPNGTYDCTTGDLVIEGSSAQPAYAPDTVAFIWEGSFGNNCAWTTTATTLATPAGDTSCTLTTATTVNAGTVTAAQFGASSIVPGVSFAANTPGQYKVCVSFQAAVTGGAGTGSFELVDGITGSTPYDIDKYYSSASGSTHSGNLCGYFSATSVGQTFNPMIRFQTSANTSNLNYNPSGGSARMNWTIEKFTQSVPAPLLVNSIVTSASAVWRIVTARISETDVVSRESGDWLSGDCTSATGGEAICSIISGTFSSTPNCTIGIEPTTTAINKACVFYNQTLSATGFTVRCHNSADGAAQNHAFNVICMGPR
jgi:hypothetical protein